VDKYKKVLNECKIISKTDPEGIITEVNNKFCEISAYSKEYLIGKSYNVVRHPDMPDKIFKKMWDNINSHKTFKGIIKNKRQYGTS
jgi:PAS domain S-box-containing protein